MKEFKGTRGPWEVHETGPHWNNKSLTHLEITFGEDGECICDTVYQRADANLIAAAPELLDALQNARRALGAGRNLDFSDWIDANRQADAAIAKALGDTK